MTEKETVVFITNDRWILENGKLDPVDKALLEEAAKLGEVVLRSPRQEFELMSVDEPSKFQMFHRQCEVASGRSLTFNDLVKYAVVADEKKHAFDTHAAGAMTKEQAAMIRSWRVDEHYTWRAVARVAFGMAAIGWWPGWGLWHPPSNQIMGMALCERAAKFFNEKYMEPPWN